jgi:hypothetical protein
MYFGAELKRFLEKMPILASSADIEGLKAVVARQMYAALAQIIILGSPMIVFFFGIRSRHLSPADLVFIVIPSAVILLIASSYKKTEKQVQTMPAADDFLAAERDKIVETWLKKPFPNW